MGAGEFEAQDRFRLREIVEFSFANAILALALVPAAATLGSKETAVRVLSVVVIVYQLAFLVVLLRRQMARGLPMGFAWVVVVGGLNLLVPIAAAFGMVRGAVSAYQWLLILLLARPMLACVDVLASFERPRDPDPTD